jgi:hypothetical protein
MSACLRTSCGEIAVRTIRAFLTALSLLTVAAALPASAETGACVSDRDGGLTCGEGPGAAGVVEGTISPSKRLAFAWRVPGRPLAEAPEADVESLLIRLSDGAVLSSAPGLYWRTGGARANHIDEGAVWSPNSRFAIEVTDAKWSTEHLRLYAIRGDDKVLVLDLKAIIEPAVRKRLQRLVKNESIYVFSAFDLAVDNRGLVEAPVLMRIPKQERDIAFAVTLLVVHKDATLVARDVALPRRTLAAPKLRERL